MSVMVAQPVKGCGVTDEGLKMYTKILIAISKERKQSEFDSDFLEWMLLGKPKGKKRKRPAKNKEKMDSITDATTEMFRVMEALENDENVVGV